MTQQHLNPKNLMPITADGTTPVTTLQAQAGFITDIRGTITTIATDTVTPDTQPTGIGVTNPPFISEEIFTTIDLSITQSIDTDTPTGFIAPDGGGKKQSLREKWGVWV